ncbi:MAG: class I SAM-dependent methyltransferase [Deltaproteobacteria bacterium]|nr:class I SAM-dependent methyltransferase [Deltaproteobacteria bacterium]
MTTGATLNSLERRVVTSRLRQLTQRWEASRLFRDIDLPANAVALEIGSGGGYGATEALERLPLAKLFVTEIDPVMLEAARSFLTGRGMLAKTAFYLADAKSLPFDTGSFDLVFSFEALHHVCGYEAAVRETARVLRADGWLLFTDIIRPPWAPRFTWHAPPQGVYSKEELISVLTEARFCIERWRSVAGIWAAVTARRSQPG